MPISKAEFRKIPCVSRWIGRLAEGGKWSGPYLRGFYKWCLWLESRGLEWRPDEMIRLQRSRVGQEAFELTDLLNDWLNGLVNEKTGEPLRRGTKEVYQTGVHGFFLHNRAELPRDRSFRLSSPLPKTRGTLTADDVRLILARSNKCYRALFLSMYMGGMGEGEGEWFSNHGLASLKRDLEDGRELIKVELPGRKAGRGTRPFYTWLGRDAKDALRLWFEERPRDCPVVFVNQFGAPINTKAIQVYWRSQVRALGLSKKNESHRKNVHNLRDLFKTRWHKSGADILAADFHMGHLTDPNDYDRFFDDLDYTKKQYLIAEPYLNLISEDPEKVPRAEMDRRIREQQELSEERYKVQQAQIDAIRRRLDAEGRD